MAAISVIGSGFSGLSAACFAAAQGHKVTIWDKHAQSGGRARLLEAGGFRFDMGPSWYWMPDVFDDFFAYFGKQTSDYYELRRLDPGFQIIFGQGETLAVPADPGALTDLFEQTEKGSGNRLRAFLQEAAYKYALSMQRFIYQPSLSWLEYARRDVLNGWLKTSMIKPMSTHVRKYFKDPRLLALLEFPVLFLGAMPDKIPALYSLMNHAALTQGTFYPMGGMHRIVTAMEDLAISLGVQFKRNTEVERLIIKDKKVTGLESAAGIAAADALIASGDYQYMEQQLLPEQYRNYSPEYWDKKTMAPSSLIFYIGVRKQLPRLQHHNLFFDTDFQQHAVAIYEKPQWPEDPLFYVCCPSKTDHSVAPDGMENLFVLVPVAAGLDDTEDIRKQYLPGIIKRIEAFCGVAFRQDIIFEQSYSLRNFREDYHAYKGNAYGLANTLRQTAVLKPSVLNKKVANLFYAGQLTVPGPGVPPALISGRIAAGQLKKYFKRHTYEAAF